MKPVSNFIRRKMKPIIEDIEKNNMTLGTVALKHGLSAQRIRQNLRDMGLESLIGEKKSIHRQPKVTNDLKLDHVRSLYFAGQSIQKIAQDAATSESAVRMQLAASLPDIWSAAEAIDDEPTE